jgi:hypothetical protein
MPQIITHFPNIKKISMDNHFSKVKTYLQELGYDITHEDPTDEVYVINDETNGIKNLVLDCEYPILVIEQYIFSLKDTNSENYRRLLQKNREIVHGAFVVDDSGKRVIFRDTLQLENLDLNELEGTLNSLKLLVAEYSSDLLDMMK